MNSATLVQKLWNYCNVLRDDGMSYGDYVEQLTYLLFLKMTDERAQPPYSQASIIPGAYSWPSLLAKDGDELFDHYRHVLEALGQQKGTLGLIFGKAQNKFQDPAKLRRLVADLIDGENWTALGVDVKGDAYEGLLEKNAQDTKSGAGQYFTPRALIQAMVDCIAPQPKERICDPACGTGGFLFTAYNHIVERHPNLSRDQKRHLKEAAFTGVELVQATARVCAMNLLLHGIGSEKHVPVKVMDALAADPGERYEVVLANPPFGKKSSTMIVGEDGRATTEKDIIERDDFWATTSNKQLNFLQHIKTLLKTHGRAAVVLPDNVLFEGGAGETIRRKLLHECEVHTLLRLPTGLFYAQGVKANVLFFDKKPASETPWTKTLWIFDLRTNMHFTLKTNPLKRLDLDEFVRLFNPANRYDRKPTWSEAAPDGRWRAYSCDELTARDKASLDIFWLKDQSLADSDNLPPPDVIAQEIVEDLEAALEQFRLIAADLSERGTGLEPEASALLPVHVLVDLENNQPTLDEVRALVPDMTDVWLFHSGKQSKHLEGFASLGSRQMAVPVSRSGKNSLDFHLSFYLGYLAAKNPGAKLIVMAIDGGYAPMIEHAVKTLGFAVDRVSVKPPAAKKKAAKKAAKSATKATKKAAKKKPASDGARKDTPTGQKTSAKKPAVKSPPAKSAAKKTVLPAKKASTVAADDKQIDRLIKGLRKMGDKAPARAKAYQQHLKSMLGKDAKDNAVEAAAAVLATRGVARIDGNSVKYSFIPASGG